jgi:hypothetical protein
MNLITKFLTIIGLAALTTFANASSGSLESKYGKYRTEYAADSNGARTKVALRNLNKACARVCGGTNCNNQSVAVKCNEYCGKIESCSKAQEKKITGSTSKDSNGIPLSSGSEGAKEAGEPGDGKTSSGKKAEEGGVASSHGGEVEEAGETGNDDKADSSGKKAERETGSDGEEGHPQQVGHPQEVVIRIVVDKSTETPVHVAASAPAAATPTPAPAPVVAHAPVPAPALAPETAPPPPPAPAPAAPQPSGPSAACVQAGIDNGVSPEEAKENGFC